MAAWLEVLPGFEEGLPLDSLAEECDHPGRFGGLGRLGLAPAGQDGAHDPVGGHTARQGAPAVGSRAREWRRLIDTGEVKHAAALARSRLDVVPGEGLHRY